MSKQRIIVIQQAGRGEAKIQGLQKYGRDLEISRALSIDTPLEPIIDDPSEYLPDELFEDADLVLSFLEHPDLVECLALACEDRGLPLVASGQSVSGEGIFAPPT